MASARDDTQTARWARAQREAIARDFEARWRQPAEGLYADSQRDCAHREGLLLQRHWTSVIPLEIGLADRAHAETAFPVLEGPDHSSAGGLSTRRGRPAGARYS
jgi:hypothetical protein